MKLNKQQRKEIHARYQAGESVRNLAAEYGVSHHTAATYAYRNLNYPHHHDDDNRVFVSAGGGQITIEDVQRWMAMETRLNLAIEQHSTSTPSGDLAGKIQEVLMKTLEFVRDGNDGS